MSSESLVHDNAIIAQARTLKGQNIKAVWCRPMKMKKSAESRLFFKESTTVVRVGINYDNRAVVKERRESGELPEENQGLIGRNWIEFPFLLQATKSGDLMIRMTPCSTDIKAKTRYFTLDQNENQIDISKDEVIKYCLASEYAKKEEAPLAFDVPVKYITLLHHAEQMAIAQ